MQYGLFEPIIINAGGRPTLKVNKVNIKVNKVNILVHLSTAIPVSVSMLETTTTPCR